MTKRAFNKIAAGLNEALAVMRRDRALELSEQGLTNWQIAERMGTNARNVTALIAKAKAEREAEQAKDEER